ncbi:hypothetical protein [Streptomyces sp. NPDC005283]|uniref:hypothetical protein n=1 Tax=Streptomyces sp. NPDC005283 TaxID=3156871 RepID=UPI003452157E
MPARQTGGHGRFSVAVVIDSHDPPALARFRSQVLNRKVVLEAEDEIVIGERIDRID